MYAADAAAQLVQVGQAVVVGLVDEDGVGVGDVQAALDDRRRHQDVGFAADERDHRLFQLVLAHLPVADDDPRLRARSVCSLSAMSWMLCTRLWTK